jgi:hypothetical protein
MIPTHRLRHWFLLAAIFGGMPLAFYLALAVPALRRIEASKVRRNAAETQTDAILPVQPLSAEEKGLLYDPSASWRQRIPWAIGDAGRLWQYHRVVTDLQATWKGAGVSAAVIRASLDPVNGSFTLPTAFTGRAAFPVGQEPGTGHLQAWVLEATLDGPPSQLFRGLDSLTRCEPILEPIGLKWEVGVDHPRQALVLRNLVLVP